MDFGTVRVEISLKPGLKAKRGPASRRRATRASRDRRRCVGLVFSSHRPRSGCETPAQVGCHASRSMRPRNLPKQASRQVALGELEHELPCMSDEASAGLELSEDDGQRAYYLLHARFLRGRRSIVLASFRKFWLVCSGRRLTSALEPGSCQGQRTETPLKFDCRGSSVRASPTLGCPPLSRRGSFRPTHAQNTDQTRTKRPRG
jgi:hypothetical protein